MKVYIIECDSEDDEGGEQFFLLKLRKKKNRNYEKQFFCHIFITYIHIKLYTKNKKKQTKKTIKKIRKIYKYIYTNNTYTHYISITI